MCVCVCVKDEEGAEKEEKLRSALFIYLFPSSNVVIQQTFLLMSRGVQISANETKYVVLEGQVSQLLSHIRHKLTFRSNSDKNLLFLQYFHFPRRVNIFRWQNT